MCQLSAALCTFIIHFLIGTTTIVTYNDQISVNTPTLSYLFTIWNNKMKNQPEEDNFSVFLLNMIASVFYFLFVFLAFRKSQFQRIKYAIVMSTFSFVLLSIFQNQCAVSMNPLFYFFFALVSLDFKVIILSSLISFLGGFIGMYVSTQIFKEYANPKLELMVNQIDMDLLHTKPLKFDI